MNADIHFATIGAMILCGLGMGTAFDVYRVACHRFSIRRWLLPGFDVVYWAAATIIVFRVLLERNAGEVRLYVFLGIGIGITGYFGLLSPSVRKTVSALFRAIQKLLRMLWRTVRALLLSPLLWIVRALAGLIDVLFVVIAALLLWIGRLLFKPLGFSGTWLWKLLQPVRDRLQPVAKFFRSVRDKWKAILKVLKGKP